MLKVFPPEYFRNEPGLFGCHDRMLHRPHYGFLRFFEFVHSAPPRVLTITSGPPGSSFETNALKYGAILASNGVTLKLLPSQGFFRKTFSAWSDPDSSES